MQPAMPILHARRRGPTITAPTSPHNSRNLPPLLRFRTARRHQDPLDGRRTHGTTRHPPTYAPDWFPPLTGTPRTLPDNKWSFPPSKARQHGRSRSHRHKPQPRHSRPLPIPDHDAAERLRSRDEEHRPNPRDESPRRLHKAEDQLRGDAGS